MCVLELSGLHFHFVDQVEFPVFREVLGMKHSLVPGAPLLC